MKQNRIFVFLVMLLCSVSMMAQEKVPLQKTTAKKTVKKAEEKKETKTSTAPKKATSTRTKKVEK